MTEAARKNGVADRILEEVLGLSTRMGKLEGHAADTNQHLVMLDRRLETGSSQMHQYGTAIARQGERIEQLQRQIDTVETTSQARRRKCSEMMRRLGGQMEDTGKFIIEESAAKKVKMALWKQLLAALGLLMAAAGSFQLGKCQHATPAQQQHAGPRPDARR